MLFTLTREATSRLLCLAAGCLLAIPASGLEPGLAETDSTIRTWKRKDGLPSESVTAIIQTRDRFLWVGTSAGLVRFDGVNFTAIQLGASPTNSAPHVTSLCEDRQGHVWAGTQQNGLFELSPGAIRKYTKARGLLADSVTSLAADTNGYVWIGTRSGLNLWSGREIKTYTAREGLPDEFVSNIHVARSGVVWITTRAGMCQFEGGRLAAYALQTESQGRSPEYLGAYEDRLGNLWAFGDTYLINLAEGKRFNYFRGNEATSVRIWSLCEGRDGRLWIGTSGRGLFCFDDNRFQPVVLGELRWPYDVRAIAEDHEGNLWLGTSGGGLIQLRPQTVHVMRTGQGLPASPPTALAVDGGGRVFVGLQRGGVFIGEGNRFEHIPTAGGLDVQDFVSSVCVARDNMVWVGTLGSGLLGLQGNRGVRLTTANGLGDDSVLSVCLDSKGSIWASTSGGTVHRFSKTNTMRFDSTHGLPGTPITVLIPSVTGGLWLGSADGVILREQKDSFHRVETGQGARQAPVLSLFEDNDKRLWIGTTGGLACWVNGVRVSWNTANGLPHDYVAGIVADGEKHLWLATGAGVFRVSRDVIQAALADPQRPLVCKLMSEAKTVAESATTSGGPRALTSGEGRIWFATSEGLVNVDTLHPGVEAETLPVYVESVAVNGDTPLPVYQNAAWFPALAGSNAMMTLRDLRSMEIRFTALSFADPESIRFRHKLEGFDPDWVVDGTTRFKRYDRLPFGHYLFRVAARRGDGPWQEAGNGFSFEVPTPVYLRTWMIVLYGMIAVAIVAALVRVVSHRRLRTALLRLEQQQSLERERMRIARDMHDEMGSKLTKISFLSEHARMDAKAHAPLAARIESIAETSRDLLKTMDEIVWVVNPRNDTLEHLAAYLSHHADEYFQNTSLECELRLPQTIVHQPVSSETRHNLFLAFEESLNNVLKHSGASKIKVEMGIDARTFKVTISDNGRGFEPAALAIKSSPPGGGRGRGGNGLKNMRQRLSEVGGHSEVHSEPGRGTTVVLSIPLDPNATDQS